MAIGTKSDFKIYDQQFWGGVVETLQQYTDAFNSASNNALRLVTRSIKGEYERESFLKSTSGLITRRDPTSVGSLTDLKIQQGEMIGVKVNRRIGPVAQTLDAFKKVAVDPGEFSLMLGQQTGKAIAVDYVNIALAAVFASISGVAALQYDATADALKTMNHTALVGGLSKFGDASSRVTCWIMHSKQYFDLMKQAIADKLYEVAGVTVYSATVPTLNRPTIVIDSPSLVTSNGTATIKYDALGLVEAAVEVAESEERNVVSDLVTGLENIVMRIQGEYAFNLRVKGCAWNTGTGVNPTDTNIGTSSNWTSIVADNKELGGIRVTTN